MNKLLVLLISVALGAVAWFGLEMRCEREDLRAFEALLRKQGPPDSRVRLNLASNELERLAPVIERIACHSNYEANQEKASALLRNHRHSTRAFMQTRSSAA